MLGLKEEENFFSMNSDIKVSVVCITYNQEKYIKDAVESFLQQKTEFEYEIIIHDDCSTDGTAEIVEEYSKKYPDKIHAILQNENQYSKGVLIIDDIIIPSAKGEYIALCEGDDYWTDENKLQKQVEALDANPKCNICAHTVSMVDANTKKEIKKVRPSKENTIFSVEQVIVGDGGFVGTNSLMIRRKVYEHGFKTRRAYPLDYTLQIVGSLNVGMLYLKDNMAAYRWCSDNSWTKNVYADAEKICKHYYRLINALQVLNNETEKKYVKTIGKKISEEKLAIVNVRRYNTKLFSKENREVLKTIPIIDIIELIIKKVVFLCKDFLGRRLNAK